MNDVNSEPAATDESVCIEEVTETIRDEPADVPVLPEGFTIRDANAASWLVRRINEARAYAQRCAAWCDREVRRAQRDEEFLLRRFGKELEDWAARAIARLHGRRRSVCLPGGTVGFRRVGPTLVFDSPEAVLRWAKSSCPKAVVIKESISKTTVNEHVAATGELPDGSHMEEGRDKFYIS